MLFKKLDLDTQLNKRREKALRSVDNFPEDEFQMSDCDKLIDSIVVESKVETIALHEKKISDPKETPVDVSDQPSFRILSPNEQTFVPGHKVTVKIPFKGDKWIFEYKTNPSILNFPTAEVQGCNLTFDVIVPDDENPESFGRKINDRINLIKEHLNNANQQINSYNENLPEWIRTAVKDRRDRIRNKQEKQKEIKNLFKSS